MQTQFSRHVCNHNIWGYITGSNFSVSAFVSPSRPCLYFCPYCSHSLAPPSSSCFHHRWQWLSSRKRCVQMFPDNSSPGCSHLLVVCNQVGLTVRRLELIRHFRLNTTNCKSVIKLLCYFCSISLQSSSHRALW